MIVLGTIKDAYKPNDLVPVIIENVINKNSSLHSNKYIIHLGSYSFGLFSERYTYVSTKELVDNIQKSGYTMQYFYQYGGFIEAMLTKNKDTKLFNLDEKSKKIIAILSNVDYNFLNIKTTEGIYIINNYAGTSKLIMGNALIVSHSETKRKISIKVDINNIEKAHMRSSIEKAEKTSDSGFSDFNVDTIKNINVNIAESILEDVMPKKDFKHMKEDLTALEAYTTWHMIIWATFFYSLKKDNVTKPIAIISKLKKEILKDEDSNK